MKFIALSHFMNNTKKCLFSLVSLDVRQGDSSVVFTVGALTFSRHDKLHSYA